MSQCEQGGAFQHAGRSTRGTASGKSSSELQWRNRLARGTYKKVVVEEGGGDGRPLALEEGDR